MTGPVQPRAAPLILNANPYYKSLERSKRDSEFLARHERDTVSLVSERRAEGGPPGTPAPTQRARNGGPRENYQGDGEWHPGRAANLSPS